MKTFEEVKEELLRKAKEAGACADGYRMGLEAENKADLLKAITKNWWWVLASAKIIDAEYLKENFTEEELNEAGIYINGIHKTDTVAFALDNATVEAYGNATVKAYGSATVKAYDNATVEACGNATVEAYGNATVKACGNATVKAYGNTYVEDLTGYIRPLGDFAIVKDYYNEKIYVKKGEFEIIEVE